MEFFLSSVFSLNYQWHHISDDIGQTGQLDLLKFTRVNHRLIYFFRGAYKFFACLENPFLWNFSLHSIHKRLEALASFYLKHVCLNYSKLFYNQTYKCHMLSKLYIKKKVFKNTPKLQKCEMHIENNNLSSFNHLIDVKPSFL